MNNGKIKTQKTKNDLWLIFGILLLAGTLYFSGLLKFGDVGGSAVVSVNGKEFKTILLNKDETFTVKIGEHFNVVEIKNGYANVIDASCPDKLCVKQSKINLENQTIVCLPNKMVVEIKGGKENDIDIISK